MKEPWQKTKAEFVLIYQRKCKEMMGRRAYSRLTDSELSAIRAEATDYQEFTIRRALAMNKLVPPEVLADYPKLATEAAKIAEVDDGKTQK